jgi:hypothetical protein
MHAFVQILLILHFLGLAMGFSTNFASFVMLGLIAKAAPQERAVLGRFPPIMSRVGEIGLALLWATGLLLVWAQWGGLDRCRRPSDRCRGPSMSSSPPSSS